MASSGNSQLVAVASRNADKARSFISSCQASVPVAHTVDALGSYEALLQRSDIDAVYIPLPTAIRTEWVLKAAAAGKHVLVEKPCGVTAAEVRSMIDACRSRNLQFMDGVMFMHSSRLPAMRSVLNAADGVGKIRHISSQFCFAAPDEWFTTNIRASSNLEPAGCLGDLGWYTIRMTLWAMQMQMPVEVRGRILSSIRRPDSAAEVPVEFMGEMHFEGGTSASFFNSFRVRNTQYVTVSGSAGSVTLDDFVLPWFGSELAFEVSRPAFVVDGCRFNMERHNQRVAVPELANNAPDAQETRMVREFSRLVLSGRPDSSWPEVTLKTQLVMDAALKSAMNGGIAIDPRTL